MKICQVTSVHDWKDDRIFERACIGLAERGYDVHLVAGKAMEFYTLDDSIQKLVDQNTPAVKIAGVNIHWIRNDKGLKRKILGSIEACKIAESINPDIIHFHDPHLLPWMIKLKKRAPHIKIIYDIHENYIQFFIRRNLPVWMQKAFRKYEQYCVSKFDGFTAITNSLADIFKPFNKNYLIIPNVPFLNRLLTLNIDIPKEEYPVFLTSGIQSDERNCRQLVQAMKHVTKEYPNAVLRMAGRYSPEGFESELTQIAKTDGVNNNVQLLGTVPWLENFERTIRAHVGLVTYKITENNKIGTPNRLFETMVCALPVIATDLPELRKIITENECGILADTNQPEEIAKAMRYLISHPEEAKKMGKNGRKAVLEKYNYERVLDNTLAFYQQLLTEKKL